MYCIGQTKRSATSSICLLCALTVFCMNVQHSPLMVTFGISSLGCAQLIFIDPVAKVSGSYYRNTILQQHYFASHLFVSTRQCRSSSCSKNSCTVVAQTSSGHSALRRIFCSVKQLCPTIFFRCTRL